MVLLLREQEPPLHHQFHQEGRQEWDPAAWNGSEGTLVTAQLLLQPLSGARAVVAQGRLPGHPCSQQEKLNCSLQNALCSNGSLQLGFPCLKPAEGCAADAKMWVGVQVFSEGFIHSIHRDPCWEKPHLCPWLCHS